MSTITPYRPYQTGGFELRLGEVTDATPVTVFLCGPEIKKLKNGGGRSRGSSLRKFLSDQIEGIDSLVVWGEHSKLRNAPPKSIRKTFSDAETEFLFAQSEFAHLIVILPCSIGSIAELGLFGLDEAIVSKMIVLVDKRYEKNKGFLVQALLKSIQNRNARGIHFVSYASKHKVWEIVEDYIRKCQGTRVKNAFNTKSSK